MSVTQGLEMATIQAGMACMAGASFTPKDRAWRVSDFSFMPLGDRRYSVRLDLTLYRTERDERDRQPLQNYILNGEVYGYGLKVPPVWLSCRFHRFDIPDQYLDFEVYMAESIGVNPKRALRLIRTRHGEPFVGTSTPRWWCSNPDLSDEAIDALVREFGEGWPEDSGFGYRLEQLGDEMEDIPENWVFVRNC
jgi:hypothetical protein